jgi:hypothetical protein
MAGDVDGFHRIASMAGVILTLVFAMRMLALNPMSADAPSRWLSP